VVQPALAIPAIATQHALSSARSLDLLSDFRVPFIGGLAVFNRVRDDPLGALVALPRVIDAQRQPTNEDAGHDAADDRVNDVLEKKRPEECHARLRLQRVRPTITQIVMTMATHWSRQNATISLPVPIIVCHDERASIVCTTGSGGEGITIAPPAPAAAPPAATVADDGPSFGS